MLCQLHYYCGLSAPRPVITAYIDHYDNFPLNSCHKETDLKPATTYPTKCVCPATFCRHLMEIFAKQLVTWSNGHFCLLSELNINQQKLSREQTVVII